MNKIAGFALVAVLVLAYTNCARSVQENTELSSNNSPITMNKVSIGGNIRFENTDSRGDFTEYKELKDPLSATYDTGPIRPNRQSSVATVRGPSRPDNRVDVALVGDGYTQNELGQYSIDASQIADGFLDQEPFSTYRNYFSFHRVDVVSQESGVDNDPAGTLKNTALDMNFGCFGIERLLCANMQKVKEHAINAPGMDLILALANSERYGGAGYWNDGVATLSARNPNALELALHELGHSFGQLGDEYSTPGSSRATCMTKINASAENEEQMLQNRTKWFRWLDLSHIGAFQGVCYSTNGFRPTQNSKMRTLGRPFEEVNSEQLILTIYKYAKPIDTATPSGTYSQGKILSVVPMRPEGHSLHIQWYLNGVAIRGQTGETLDTAKVKMTRATQTISVTVIDPTDKVRDESQRQQWMSDKRSWEIRKLR